VNLDYSTTLIAITILNPLLVPAWGALAVVCMTGFGGALTSTHMYDTPSNIPHHTKFDGECYHS
jgi:hypothetical protein